MLEVCIFHNSSTVNHMLGSYCTMELRRNSLQLIYYIYQSSHGRLYTSIQHIKHGESVSCAAGNGTHP